MASTPSELKGQIPDISEIEAACAKGNCLFDAIELHAEQHRRLGDAYLEHGQTADAIKAYERAMGLTYQYFGVHHKGHGSAVDSLADALVANDSAGKAVTLRLGRVKAIDELIRKADSDAFEAAVTDITTGQPSGVLRGDPRAKASAATLVGNSQDGEANQLSKGGAELRASRVLAIQRLGETCLAAGQVEDARVALGDAVAMIERESELLNQTAAEGVRKALERVEAVAQAWAQELSSSSAEPTKMASA